MTNEKKLLPIIEKFYDKIIDEDYVIDKSGVKTVELIAEKIELNPSQNFLNFKDIRKTPIKYVEKELNWYLSKNLSINNYVDDIKIWNDICTKDDKKEVNSNYGWCLFSEENYLQYENCLNELKKNRDSRRAIMIYNRPSMQNEHNRNGMSDFICCLYNQFLIRNNRLISIVNFRSNDFIYGFFNDFYFKCYIYEKLFLDLLREYPYLERGNITWISNSLHVYENHFNVIKNIYETYSKELL